MTFAGPKGPPRAQEDRSGRRVASVVRNRKHVGESVTRYGDPCPECSSSRVTTGTWMSCVGCLKIYTVPLYVSRQWRIEGNSADSDTLTEFKSSIFYRGCPLFNLNWNHRIHGNQEIKTLERLMKNVSNSQIIFWTPDICTVVWLHWQMGQAQSMRRQMSKLTRYRQKPLKPISTPH